MGGLLKASATNAAVAILLLCSGYAQETSQYSPFFAKAAVYAYLGNSAIAPNGKKVVSVQVVDIDAGDFPALVMMKTDHGESTGKIRFGLNAQVLWRKDSKAFAVTGSSEGGNGQYHTSVFLVRDRRLIQVDLTSVIETAFGHPVKCGWPESPNVVAVKWVGPQLLMAAQIINHSNCDCFGTFRGFLVDVENRAVVRSYNQLVVKQRFGDDLGPWLQNANDDWVRNPRSCYVPSNHPELAKGNK